MTMIEGKDAEQRPMHIEHEVDTDLPRGVRHYFHAWSTIYVQNDFILSTPAVSCQTDVFCVEAYSGYDRQHYRLVDSGD